MVSPETTKRYKSSVGDHMKMKERLQYKIRVASEVSEKRDAVLQCESAFENPQNNTHVQILDKLCTYAEFLIAEASQLLGYCAVYANDQQSKVAYISLLCVKKEYQGMGIGKALLQACEDLAREKGMTVLRLEVKEDNEKAIRLYRGSGLIIRDRKLNKFIMEKALTTKHFAYIE